MGRTSYECCEEFQELRRLVGDKDARRITEGILHDAEQNLLHHADHESEPLVRATLKYAAHTVCRREACG